MSETHTELGDLVGALTEAGCEVQVTVKPNGSGKMLITDQHGGVHGHQVSLHY